MAQELWRIQRNNDVQNPKSTWRTVCSSSVFILLCQLCQKSSFASL